MNLVLFILLVSILAGVMTALVIKEQSKRLKIFGIVFLIYLIGGRVAGQEVAVSIGLFVACFFCPYSTVIWFQQKKQRHLEKMANRNQEPKQ